MTLDDVKAKLMEVLMTFGVILPEGEADFAINDYIVDSLQYVALLVGIEQSFEIELPEEMLHWNALSSFEAFCNSLFVLCQAAK